LHAGNAGAAQRYLDAVEPMLDVTPYGRFRYLNRYQLLRAELALAMRDPGQTRHWAQEARVLAEAKNVRKNVALSWLLGGRALLAQGSLEAAGDELRRGLAVADAVQNAALSWQARLWFAKVLEAQQQQGAGDLYRDAQERIDAITSQLPDQRLRDCFGSSQLVLEVRQSVDAGAARPKTRAPAGLTQREVEVLRLVASGATNAYVAKVLSISPRTVDVHMTSILSKTGCANRAAAVGFALRNGLS
jgi:DNA-binding NarL/FixJ family response regulator